jgi:hypothetical protein
LSQVVPDLPGEFLGSDTLGIADYAGVMVQTDLRIAVAIH